MTNLIGQILGRYHVLEQLGEGGMATVYKARDLNLNRDVAVKIIRADVFGSAVLQRLLERFKREGLTLAKLTHPNIVPILDYGDHNGVPFLVMPYLPGGTLKHQVRTPIPYRQAVRMLIPVAQALSHAHQQGVIHRDVKPSNILITRTGEPMLSDFGIAKLLDTEETRELTGTGVGIGTPEYMAPEQAVGQTDERADIYALGIVLYELITGRIPYRADTPMAILIKKREEPLPRPKSFIPDLPVSVENVLLKSLARDPQNRYQTAQEFIAALERLERGDTITATMTMPSAPIKNSIWLWAGLGAIGLLFACMFATMIFLLRDKIFPAAAFPLETATIAPTIIPASVIPPIENNPSPVLTIAAFTEIPTVEQIPPTAVLDWTATPFEQSRINPMDQAEMIHIPAAVFEMGLTKEQARVVGAICNDCTVELKASQIRHAVTLDAYWIYKTEVSNAMYRICEQSGNCSPPTANYSDAQNANRKNYHNAPKFDNYPVTHITWEMAEQYCQWAGGTLPTEAQWEYAARGPNGNLYPWGNQVPSPSLANLNNYTGDTAAVDSYPAGLSYFGLYNMTGNVWEWLFDWYQVDYYQTNADWNNPSGPNSGDIKDGQPLKSGRGGAYWISLGGSNPGLRDWYQVGKSGSAVGFRCVVPVTP